MRNNFALRWIVPKKRIGRLAFAERMVLTLLAPMWALVYFSETPLLMQASRLIVDPKTLLLWLIAFWVFFSWRISRLHDIGKGISGRWLAIIFFIFILISLNIDLIRWGSEDHLFSWYIVFIASTAMPIVILDALLLAAPGNIQKNRHGSTPDGHDSICIFLSSKFRRANVEPRQITKIHSNFRSIYGSSLKTKVVCWTLGTLVLLGEIITFPLVSYFFWETQDRNIDRLLSARSLNRAIKYDVAWAVDMWMAIGADINSPSRSGSTPLHYAAQTGNAEIVEKLLEAGVNPHIRSQSRRGMTAMHTAAAYGNAEVIKVLLGARADPNVQTKKGMLTPLHYAARASNNTEVIKILIEAGADPNAQDTNLDTPLHWTVSRVWWKNLDVIKALIKFGADVHIENRWGKTPMDRAIKSGRRETFEFLYKPESQK